MLPTTATAASTAPPPPPAPAASSGEPHEALLLSLGHLRLRELLACRRVCRRLRDAVAGDPLLWRSLAVEPPLSYRITDEALLGLTERAEGRLRLLHLLGCPRVSDAGLLRVVERNPCVTELFVPSCTGLTADGLVKIIQFLHEHKGNLSRIRLHGICKMTNHHLDVINSLMCKSSQQQDAQALYYNHRVHEVLNTEDECPIDVDVCPICRNVREVKDSWSPCRGCFFCVARCETCGGCIDLEELGETGLACSDFLCMDCWLKLPKCCTCNRPYCERHSNFKENLSPSGQFTCQECAAFATSLESLEEGY
ncbi:F-box protein SKIP28-like isoform X2 [Phragmites australis]|uniref:F-box protein SKIP28-like isoform X2 n=1 Tax=Phragmites australis TaxID=29695 RepID=UPI002D795D82|nr:F-box protein SKIP28-like isoform X2 [Phragmites australis]